MTFPQRCLATLGTIYTGSTPSTSDEQYWGGGIPFVTPSELDQRLPVVTTPRTLTAEGGRQSRLIREGAVMVCCIGSLGKIGIAGQALATNQQINSIEFDPQQVWPKFGYYACQTLKPKLVTMAPATTIAIVSKSKFSQLEIPIPTLPYQRRIAAILDQADALRAKRREALAQLDSLTQSIFIEMFGDPVKNEKGWETRSLLESCDQINDCPHSTPTWTEFGEIGLRTSNLTAGGWNWDETRYVSSETYHERSKRGYVTTGDIVLSREGTVGIAAIVTSEMKVCMGQRLVQVRPTRSLLSSEFLLRHLLFVLSPKRIGQLMVGSTSQHLNVKELKLLKIPLPPVSLQLEFSQISASLDFLKKAAGDSLNELDTLFASLQHRAFRGEL